MGLLKPSRAGLHKTPKRQLLHPGSSALTTSSGSSGSASATASSITLMAVAVRKLSPSTLLDSKALALLFACTIPDCFPKIIILTLQMASIGEGWS
ncbi:Coiled-coil domain-containing protein 13 [Frankliniella fusca]|uniref:Coiled-coil domain-containing protein 13 n=1 Tax=Frankliniella fusca TaxID=407009 RepID=A0AAE1LT57_9NEOP|nr:Coiled-coil domain-containing protein 13 [Frankliniella fusca]KAK3923437.1 Coiled-coil domain-containing protein 13 [Frankliniella fusca]KAK3931128.1 Coiled-coil domain-containing protein 13 [Frankliniella fusca]